MILKKFPINYLANIIYLLKFLQTKINFNKKQKEFNEISPCNINIRERGVANNKY